MEYETINKETTEMKQLISSIKGLTNRVRSIAQTYRPLFEGEIYLPHRTGGLRETVPVPSYPARLSG